MECDKTSLDEDFDDGGETLSVKETENINSYSTVEGSPQSISVSLDSQDSGSSSSTKVLGYNYNGTVVFTSSPKNQAELQLYRVMQRASLLSYYDTLLEMGGDDVQQLCDAGEEEFLEIMALVGMAAKPLHVRRFQKALREWLTNPLMFQTSMTSPASSCILPRPLSVHNVSSSPLSSSASITSITSISSPHNAPLQQQGEISSCTSASPSSPANCSASSTSPTSPIGMRGTQVILEERQMRKLEEAALNAVQDLQQLEPKRQNAKKKISKELQVVLNMSTDDPFRLQQIRKFSAIYGRFDCKRKPEKPLTLHEISVNEAAAQLCKHVPTLLTRRDELFPLARKVVRNSGYHYSKGHSKSFDASKSARSTSLMNTFKYHDHFREKITSENADTRDATRTEEKLKSVKNELHVINNRLERLTNRMDSVSRETNEFSSLKHRIETCNQQKLQLLQEHEYLSNKAHLAKESTKSGMSSHLSPIDSEDPQKDEVDLRCPYIDGSGNSNDSQSCADEDTQNSDTISIQDDELFVKGGVQHLESKKICCKPDAANAVKDKFQGKILLRSRVTSSALRLSGSVTKSSSTRTAKPLETETIIFHDEFKTH